MTTRKASEALLDIALDLTTNLPARDRYKRIVERVGDVVACDACALMRYENGLLIPVATIGLNHEVMNRQFHPDQHPRLKAILESRKPVRFKAEDRRPDPFDELVANGHSGALSIHSCMGCALYVADELVGTLSIDAFKPGSFQDVDDNEFQTFAALAATAMRTANLIEALEQLAERRGKVANELIAEALTKSGGQLLGDSPVMKQLESEIQTVASSDLAVLLMGDTGTGKDLVARIIHAKSHRHDKPLVYVNCAALPESMAESELFGHVKGAFTGAMQERLGKFELAHEGTIFLDEIGEMPLTIQPKLLRVLQSGEIQRVGSDRHIEVDVRVIAATNRNLQEAVRENRFRPDLFHRLSVYPIHTPMLSDHPEDIGALANYFLERNLYRFGLRSAIMDQRALDILTEYSWPGNVRELEHVISRAALRAKAELQKDRIRIIPKHLSIDSDQFSRVSGTTLPNSSQMDSAGTVDFHEEVNRFKKHLLSSALEAENGNWANAAKRLSLDRSNIHHMAKRLDLK